MEEEELRLFHASLGDFLTDHSRSGDTYFLNRGVCHRHIVNRIVKLRLNPSGIYFHLVHLIVLSTHDRYHGR